MRSQRSDLSLLLMSAGPILLGLILWLHWESTGTVPVFGVVSLPSVPLPNLPPLEAVIPSPIYDFTIFLRDNAGGVLIGAGIFVVALIMLSGIWVDIKVALRERALAATARREEQEMEEAAADYAAAHELRRGNQLEL